MQYVNMQLNFFFFMRNKNYRIQDYLLISILGIQLYFHVFLSYPISPVPVLRSNGLLPAGVPGVDCSADGDVRLCGCFHLCAWSEVIRHGQRLDLLGVLRNILRVGLCDQLLWKLSPETSMEPGRVGKSTETLFSLEIKAEGVSSDCNVLSGLDWWCIMVWTVMA